MPVIHVVHCSIRRNYRGGKSNTLGYNNFVLIYFAKTKTKTKLNEERCVNTKETIYTNVVTVCIDEWLKHVTLKIEVDRQKDEKPICQT